MLWVFKFSRPEFKLVSERLQFACDCNDIFTFAQTHKSVCISLVADQRKQVLKIILFFLYKIIQNFLLCQMNFFSLVKP